MAKLTDESDNGAVGDVRVSTVEQSRHGYSQDIDQPREIEQICERDGLQLVKSFVEHPQSAKTNDRPEFQAMLAYCIQNGITHIVARMWERLSRSEDPAESGEFLGDLKRHRIMVHLSTGSIDIANVPTDGFRAYLEQWAAAEDNAKRREKARAAWRTRRSLKLYLAAKPPHGLDCIRKHRQEDGTIVPGRYVINQEEAAAVRHVFSRFLAGAGSNAIARELVAEGWRRRNGSAFDPEDILKILDKPIYSGYMVHQGELIKAENVEPLISYADWLTAHKIRESRRTRNVRTSIQSVQADGQKRSPDTRFIYSGLCHCARCGAPMVRHTSTCTLKSGERKFYA